MRTSIRLMLGVLLTAALTTMGAAHAASPKADQADGLEHYERDVRVIIGSTLRTPDDTTSPAAELFNVAGVNLGVTWGQWTAATAASTMTKHGPHTDAALTLAGLVPGGVYSLFFGTLTPDSRNPLCPNAERTLPLTSRDKQQAPDPASFVAAPDGSATFSARVEGDPLSASQVFITLVYHLDGQTWGDVPNHGEFSTQGDNCRSSFAEDAMRQLIVLQKW